MAQTVSWSPGDGVQFFSVALNATAANSTKVTLPMRARSAQLRVLSSAGAAEDWRISHAGTDGSALTSGTYMQILSGESFTLPPVVGENVSTDATRSIYVTGTSANAVLYGMLAEMTE